MTRIFGHNVPNELLLLGLVELTIGFFVAFASLDAMAMKAAAPGSIMGFGAAAGLSISALLISFAIGLFRPQTFLELRRVVIKTVVAALISAPVICVACYVLRFDVEQRVGGHLPDHGQVWPFDMLAAWIGLLLAIRLVFSYSLRMNMFARRVVVLGDDLSCLRTVRAVEYQSHGLLEITAQLAPFQGSAHEAETLVQQLRRRRIWGVVMGPSGDAQAQARLTQAAGTKLCVWDERQFWESQLRRIDIDLLTEADMTAWHSEPRTAFGRKVAAVIGRAGDIALSLFLLILTLPLMLLTALAIKLDNPGPVFYRQERVGLGGVPFVLTKFRSMRVDAESAGPVWASKKDSRVTRVGAFMRATRIDELPQLICVLSGQMSFIGPRPERPHFVEKLANVIPFYHERSRVRPGLTGWAQVNYPYGASIEDARMKLSYDLYYARHRSLFLDVLILFSTIRVILFQEGAR